MPVAVFPLASIMNSVTDRRGRALLACARNAIAGHLGLETIREEDHPALKAPGASFVTLYRHGELRGCIGSLSPHRRSLADDVRHNALAAAFHDPRFPPLERSEWSSILIEVSVLGQPQPMEFVSESDLIAQLVPGRDGLILRSGLHQSTFLPSVWQTLQDPHEFLSALKRKAGLSGDFWDTSIQIERYGVDAYAEHSERGDERGH